MTFNATKRTGLTRRIMEEHLMSPEVVDNTKDFIKFSFIGLGQGGGRIASEFARFGFPTYLFNTSTRDMEDHYDVIPRENCILTKTTESNFVHDGTDKNADIGFAIANEMANKRKFAEVLTKPEVANSDFVWVTVSLGGGTGNGSLPVVLDLLKKVREHKKTSADRALFGVICSIPATFEGGSKVRENALKGIVYLQELIDKKEIGSVIVIDNEKLKYYYDEEGMKRQADGDYVDYYTYSNIKVALAVIESAAIPLFKGRVVFDMAEYVGTISTPGWLSISKSKQTGDSILTPVIKQMFEENELLADSNHNGVINAAAAILLPSSKSIPTSVQDKAMEFASLNYSVRNRGIVKVQQLKSILLYGLSVSLAQPVRIKELEGELTALKEIEEEKANSSIEHNTLTFNASFNPNSTFKPKSSGNISLDDLLSDDNSKSEDKSVARNQSEDIILTVDDLIK